MISVKAISPLVFHRPHGIIIREIPLIFIVLDDGLTPFPLVTERFPDQEHRLGGPLLVVGETLQDTGSLLDDLVILLAFFHSRARGRLVRNAVQTGFTEFASLIVKPFRIEHMVQVGATRAPLKQEGGKSQYHIAETTHRVKIQKSRGRETGPN